MLGLDLGSQAVKVVELTLEGSSLTLTGLAHAEVPAGEEVVSLAAEAMEKARFRVTDAVCGVAGQSVVVRYLSMVAMPDAELRQAIRFESDRYLPFDADEVVLDCQRLDRPSPTTGESDAGAGRQMDVVLAACRVGLVRQRIAEVGRLSLVPRIVDIEAFALGNAWEHFAPRGIDEAVAVLVHVGAQRTQVNVLVDGESCFSREIGIGGAEMTRSIGRVLALGAREAEALKLQPGERGGEIAAAVAPVLEDLAGELTLSLDYLEHRAGPSVDRLTFCGGGVKVEGAVVALEGALGREVRIWNPAEALAVDEDRVDLELLERIGPQLAIPLGLASRVVVA